MKLPAGFGLHSVEVFMLTAELGGMTQSAEHLGMTQSAVSQTMSKLENALQTKLFDRSTRPMALTASGRYLFRNGSRLVSEAKGLVGDVRASGEIPIESVTIAMAESIANLVTAPMLEKLQSEAARWRIRSGISPLQHHDFLTRKLDMLITASNELDNVRDLDHYPILDEEFVLVFPANYAGHLNPTESRPDLPFVRYSLLSAVGVRIESQLMRLKLRLKNSLEVDTTRQQLSAVSAGLGWSITTPLCLAGHPDILSDLRVEPMDRARFRRHFRLVNRRGEFGELPAQIAETVRHVIHDSGLVALNNALPWLEEKVTWPAVQDTSVGLSG